MRWRRESQISNSLRSQNNNFAHASHFFCTFLCRQLRDYPWKYLIIIFMFCEGRKQAMTKFILFMNLDMVDRNSAPEEFACIWQSKWVGIITIETEKMWVHSSCDVFVVVSCRGILNSLIFTKAWSMQAWIPVVSSSLYFWKSVFSFRADSILKSDGDFISNWKFPDCVHFFGAWARQSVVYELTKGTPVKLFADWAQLILSISCAQSGTGIRLRFWK